MSLRNEIITINEEENLDENKSLITKDNSCLNKCLTFFTPVDSEEIIADTRSFKQKIIPDIIAPSIAESVFTIGFSLYVSSNLGPYANKWYQRPVFYSGLYTLINTLSRIYNSSDNFRKNILLEDPEIEIRLKTQVARILRSCLFTLGDASRVLALHEFFHALAGYIVYKNPQPTLLFDGGILIPGGGVTKFKNRTLSAAGEKIGAQNARTFVSGMGPGGELLTILSQLTIAQVLSNKAPQISMYLRLSSLASIVDLVIYAIGAYRDNNCEGPSDFCRLKEAGLSPTLMIAIIAGLTLVYQLTLSASSFLINNSKCKKEEPKVEELSEDETEHKSLKR